MYKILQGLLRVCGVAFVILHSMFLGIGRKGSWVQDVGGINVVVGIVSRRVSRVRNSSWVVFIGDLKIDINIDMQKS